MHGLQSLMETLTEVYNHGQSLAFLIGKGKNLKVNVFFNRWRDILFSNAKAAKLFLYII